jgi:transglutaminase/protease-like cytokinesis protein 3
MKHGDKAKAKASKASGKKTSAAGGKSGKAVKNLKSSKQQSVTTKSDDTKKTGAAAKTGGGGNGNAKGRPPEGIHFTNPTVGAAFKRAVKKFANAFRRLTD